MATIGEMSGGRNGFSCTRPVLDSQDKKDISRIAEEEKKGSCNPSAAKAARKFRRQRQN